MGNLTDCSGYVTMATQIMDKTLRGFLLRLTGYERDIALVAGLSMAQIGEFSFVLAAAGFSAGALGYDIYRLAIAVTVGAFFLLEWQNYEIFPRSALDEATRRAIYLAFSFTSFVLILVPVAFFAVVSIGHDGSAAAGQAIIADFGERSAVDDRRIPMAGLA